MQKTLTAFLLLCLPLLSAATRISGKVTDQQGNVLPYASVSVKGTGKGTTTGQQGDYFLQLDAGTYTLVCQYVGYTRQEQTITISTQDAIVNFQLAVQQTSMKEVIVKSGGEDPAYAIIRHAIQQKAQYRDKPDSFTCEAYIKTLMKLRKLPTRILGRKIKEEDKNEMRLDSTGKGIIYLSESLTRVAFQKNGRSKLEVISGRESGSNGFGFNFPIFIDFYHDNVEVLGSQVNQRGFVSPIADGALNFYRYKYLGTFWEEGREINQIKVIPRRNYEPLFSGTINITEGDWRIHSLDLILTKTAQLQLLDTVVIKQLQAPVGDNHWRTRNQSVYFTFNVLGVDAVGNFVNVYNQYNLHPVFPPKYFDKVLVKYDTAVNKKTSAYWDSIRPLPLDPEELRDYHRKDSLFARERDSAKQIADSLRKKQAHLSIGKLLMDGYSRSDYNPKGALSFNWQPLLPMVQYNTVEGLVVQAKASISKHFKAAQRQLTFAPAVRYGFSNHHLNAWGTLYWQRRDTGEYAFRNGRSGWQLSGGKRISSFNSEGVLTPLVNEIYTLFVRRNYLKLYENKFAQLQYHKDFDNEWKITAAFLYEDRLPLDNSTDYSIIKNGNVFTPNYPYEKIPAQFTQHQAAITRLTVQYQPGQRYIQYPHNKVAIGSDYPTFSLQYQRGWNGILGSDVNFDKWKLSAWDDINFKLYGQFQYRIAAGGFLNRKSVFIQDYQHFNGNETIFASAYLNSFQFAPYYANSTTASFYTEAHVEHHFNGMLTNKIPLFKKLNWNLVVAGNAFLVNGNNNYVEFSAGLENIFKVLRVDVGASYLNGKTGQVGIRIGAGGLLGGALK